MNKNVIAIICLCGFFIAVWITARVTHVLVFYNVTSVANEPTLMRGQIVTASRLKRADINTFICFTTGKTKYTLIYRCVAKENDMVEIRAGALYVNSKKLDEPYTWNQYYISKGQLNTIRGALSKYDYPVYNIDDSLSAITFTAADMKNYHLNLKPLIIPESQVDSTMLPLFVNFRYNRDNFGPIKVPKDSYFLLGDNRHDAYDSRYVGFVKSKDVVCTLIR